MGPDAFSAGPFWIWQVWVGPMGEQPIWPTRRRPTDATRWFGTAFGCFWMSIGLNQIVKGSWPWPLAILNGLVVTALVACSSSGSPAGGSTDGSGGALRQRLTRSADRQRASATD